MFNRHAAMMTLCAMLVAFDQSQSLQACEFHGGFSGSPWNSFGPLSGRTPRDSLLIEHVDNTPIIDIFSPPMIRAKVREEKALTVSYDYFTESEDPAVELSIDIGPEVVVAENTINLAGANGQHTFILHPQATGAYRLKVTARNLNDENIPAFHKTIYVNIHD